MLRPIGFLFILLILFASIAVYGYSGIEVRSEGMQSITLDAQLNLRTVSQSAVRALSGNLVGAASSIIEIEVSGKIFVKNTSFVPVYIPSMQHQMYHDGKPVGRPRSTPSKLLMPGNEESWPMDFKLDSGEIPKIAIDVLMAGGEMDVTVKSDIELGPFSLSKTTISAVPEPGSVVSAIADRAAAIPTVKSVNKSLSIPTVTSVDKSISIPTVTSVDKSLIAIPTVKSVDKSISIPTVTSVLKSLIAIPTVKSVDKSIAISTPRSVLRRRTETPTPRPTSTPTPLPLPSRPATPVVTAVPRSVHLVSIESVDKQKEVVVIVNHGAIPVTMAGWTLVSENGNEQFTFPDGLVLNAGESIQVRTRSVRSVTSPRDVITWKGSDVWDNNSRDSAALYDQTGQLVDRWEDTS